MPWVASPAELGGGLGSSQVRWGEDLACRTRCSLPAAPRRGWPRGVQGMHVAAAAASEERRAAQGRGTRNKKEETLPVGNTIVWSASTWLFK